MCSVCCAAKSDDKSQKFFVGPLFRVSIPIIKFGHYLNNSHHNTHSRVLKMWKSRRLKVTQAAHDIRRRAQPDPRASRSMGILTLVLLSLVKRAKANISLGYSHSCAVLTDGSAKCWGSGSDGRLGRGGSTSSSFWSGSTPVLVSGIATVTSLALGDFHSCAVLTDGSAKCWGKNTDGQLGDGTTTSSSTPVSVSGISTAVSIALGSYHSCAVLTDGSIKCWGKGSSLGGLLGDGTTTSSSTPVSVSGITTARSIALGDYFSCAVLTDGSAKCWGNNGYGQLGDGSTTHSSIPVSVSGISTAASISLGSIHSCAVLTDMSVKCWGDNSDGRLGDGSTTDSATPVSVTGISTAVSVALGYSYSCAVLTSGSAKCWGTNSYGQLGDGSTTGSLTPVSVTGISTASSIALGSYHSCALLTDELAKCWGNNDSGQLGDGSQTSSSIPVSVIDTCDASAAPTSGGVGDCTNSLASGSTCQPTCNSGYTVSGTSSCSAGTLTTATCTAGAKLYKFSTLLNIEAGWIDYACSHADDSFKNFQYHVDGGVPSSADNYFVFVETYNSTVVSEDSKCTVSSSGTSCAGPACQTSKWNTDNTPGLQNDCGASVTMPTAERWCVAIECQNTINNCTFPPDSIWIRVGSELPPLPPGPAPPPPPPTTPPPSPPPPAASAGLTSEAPSSLTLYLSWFAASIMLMFAC